MTNDVAVGLCAVLFLASVLCLFVDVLFLRTMRRMLPVVPVADINIDASGPSLEAAARRAVEDSGVTGREAEQLYAGLLDGLKQAKARGTDHGVIAITIENGVQLSKARAVRNGTRLLRDDDDGMMS